MVVSTPESAIAPGSVPLGSPSTMMMPLPALIVCKASWVTPLPVIVTAPPAVLYERFPVLMSTSARVLVSVIGELVVEIDSFV